MLDNVGEKLYVLNKYAKKCRDIKNIIQEYIDYFNEDYYGDFKTFNSNTINSAFAEGVDILKSMLKYDICYGFSNIKKAIDFYSKYHQIYFDSDVWDLGQGDCSGFYSRQMLEEDIEQLCETSTYIEHIIDDGYVDTEDEAMKYITVEMEDTEEEMWINWLLSTNTEVDYLELLDIENTDVVCPSYKSFEKFAGEVSDLIEFYFDVIRDLEYLCTCLSEVKREIYELKERILSHYNKIPVGYHQLFNDDNNYLIFEIDNFSFHTPTTLDESILAKRKIPILENLSEQIGSDIDNSVLTSFEEALSLFTYENFTELNNDFIKYWSIEFLSEKLWREEQEEKRQMYNDLIAEIEEIEGKDIDTVRFEWYAKFQQLISDGWSKSDIYDCYSSEIDYYFSGCSEKELAEEWGL